MILYTITFVSARIVTLFSFLKTPRPISTEMKNEAIAEEIVKAGAWIGGICFIVGDNISTVFALKAEDLNCDEDCLHAVGDTATMLLVIASLLFSINEIHGGKLIILINAITRSLNSDDIDDRWHVWGKLAELIAFIRVFHSSYATIASLQTEASNGCESYEFGITGSMFVVLMIIWTALTIVVMGPGIIRSVRNHDIRKTTQIISFTFVLIIATGLILVASNNEPLGCGAFDCDVFSSNFTTDCDQTSYHGTKIAFLSASMILLTPLIIGLSIRYFKLLKRSTKSKNHKHSQEEKSELDEFK